MRTICAMLALMCCCGSAAAHPDHDTAGRNLAATCANCHGTDGRSTSHIKSLAGADKALLLSKLRAFRDGSQSATIMHQIAAGYSDEQLELIAGYFSTRKP